MLTLTADELRELTGKHRSDAQRRALIRMGLTFRERPDHSLAVLRAHVQAVLGATMPQVQAEPELMP